MYSFIIDAHIHTAFNSAALRESARVSGVDYSAAGLKMEMEKDNIQYAVSMGLESNGSKLIDKEAPTPIMDEASDKNIILVGGINPYRLDNYNLSELEKALSAGRIRGLKIYLGYFEKYAYDNIYKMVYELASRYNAPVIFHTGDTYDRSARVRFAHPLTIDEVAVDFTDTKFVIAHIGNPWTIDAGEVIYKNDNVYGDLSGLFVGDVDLIERLPDSDLENIIKAYRWVNNPGKFLYGSDWPIVPMKPYINLMERVLKEAAGSEDYQNHAEGVFYLNAKELFRI